MVDLLLAVVAVALLGGLAVLALYGLVVAPFVVAVDRAERQGLSTARAGALQLALTGAALVLALGLRDVPVVAVPALALAWVLPVVLGLARPRLLGRAGAHEAPGARAAAGQGGTPSAADGTAAGGSATDESAAVQSAADGSAADGSAADGSAADGRAAVQSAADGSAAERSA